MDADGQHRLADVVALAAAGGVRDGCRGARPCRRPSLRKPFKAIQGGELPLGDEDPDLNPLRVFRREAV
jgi:hypothetical protein